MYSPPSFDLLSNGVSLVQNGQPEPWLEELTDIAVSIWRQWIPCSGRLVDPYSGSMEPAGPMPAACPPCACEQILYGHLAHRLLLVAEGGAVPVAPYSSCYFQVHGTRDWHAALSLVSEQNST